MLVSEVMRSIAMGGLMGCPRDDLAPRARAKYVRTYGQALDVVKRRQGRRRFLAD